MPVRLDSDHEFDLHAQPGHVSGAHRSIKPYEPTGRLGTGQTSGSEPTSLGSQCRSPRSGQRSWLVQFSLQRPTGLPASAPGPIQPSVDVTTSSIPGRHGSPEDSSPKCEPGDRGWRGHANRSLRARQCILEEG